MMDGAVGFQERLGKGNPMNEIHSDWSEENMTVDPSTSHLRDSAFDVVDLRISQSILSI